MDIIKTLKRIVANYRILVEDSLDCYKQFLRRKKILVISDQKIISIPISEKIQFGVVVTLLGLMLWTSYSTGIYFAYDTIITSKEKEIWNSNVTNENLKFQVSDLNENLVALNNYFEKMQTFDQFAARKTAGDSNQKLASAADDANPDEPRKILKTIRGRISERITTLESIIEMTGIKIEDIAVNNGDIKKALSNSSSRNQGGPFIDATKASADNVDPLSFNREDFDSEVNYLLHLEEVIHKYPLSEPMKRYYLTSGFGKRSDPIRKQVALHSGLDLVGPSKSKIYSTAPGKVVYADRFSAYGNFVEIDHGNGMSTRYGHLSRILVKKGQMVKRGQVVGIEGSTGRSTGKHLHYEVRYNNQALDPINFLKAGKYVF